MQILLNKFAIKWFLSTILLLSHTHLVSGNTKISARKASGPDGTSTSEEITEVWFHGVYPAVYVIGIVICGGILIWIAVRTIIFYMAHYPSSFRALGDGTLDFITARVLKGTTIQKMQNNNAKKVFCQIEKCQNHDSNLLCIYKLNFIYIFRNSG